MNKAKGMGLAVLLGLAASAAASDKTDPKPIAFTTYAKVVVDAAGVPTKVEADRNLPQELRTYIEGLGARWRFEPISVQGGSGTGATYVSLGACAVPEATGGYRFAIDYRYNGPGRPGGVLSPPRYPVDAMVERIEGTLFVTMEVKPDGRAVIQETAFEGAEPRHERFFTRTARDWVRNLQFMPEELDGVPVATRIRVPVQFTMGSPTPQEKAAATSASPACSAAAGVPAMLPVALDSPFKRRPDASVGG